MKPFGILFISLGVMLLLVGVVVMVVAPEDAFTKQTVKCYDRYSNEIKGLECESVENGVADMILLGTFLSLLGVCILWASESPGGIL